MPKTELLKVNLLGDATDAKKAFAEVRSAADTTMKGVAAAAAASSAAFALVSKSVFDTGVEMDRVRAKMEVSGGSMAFVRKESERLGLELLSSANSYGSLTAASKGAELQGEATNKIWLASASAATALGLSTEQSTGMLKAFEQMISKGNVQAEELRGQLGERLPGAFGLAADSMGVSTQELNKMLDRGEVLASDLLPKLSEEMLIRFAPAAEQMALRGAAATKRLGNDFLDLKTAIADDGSYQSFINVLNVFHKEIKSNESGINDLSSSVSNGLISSMQVGIFATAELAKGMAALTAVDDVLRLGVDKTSGVIVDAFSAELEGISGLLMMIRDVTGQDLGVASIEATISSMDELRRGIAASEQESVGMLDSAVASANDSINKIDALSQKLFLAAENGRNTGKKDNQGDIKTLGGTKPVASTGNAAAAQAEAQKVIDIHSVKFKRMQVMGETFGLSEADRLFAQNDLEMGLLDQERNRMIQAAASQGASKESLAALDLYYDEQKVNRAQETNDRLTEIDARAREELLQRITDGEQAAYDLKAQFQQLTTDNQQVNLDAMASNLAAFAKASAQWDKFTGDQKLQFASASLGALSGLMSSHNRKQFEVGKAAAQGENAINTYLGATKAYQAMSGIPYIGPVLGAAAAVAVVAAGMANAQKISSAKMGGSTGGVAVPTVSAGGGGSVPTAPINPSTGIPQSQQSSNNHPQQQVNVYVSGVISQDQLVNEIVPTALKDKVMNEDFLLIDGRSRQAQELAA